MPLVVLNKNSVRVIGDRIQSWRDMRGSLRDPPCLASCGSTLITETNVRYSMHLKVFVM